MAFIKFECIVATGPQRHISVSSEAEIDPERAKAIYAKACALMAEIVQAQRDSLQPEEKKG